MKATTFVSRSSSFASDMLSSRGLPSRTKLKRHDRRRARHCHNAELSTISLNELRQELRVQMIVAPTKREEEVQVNKKFEPQFLLSDVSAPLRFVEVLVKRRSSSRSRMSVGKLLVAA